MTDPDLELAKEVFFEYMDLDDYPKHRIIVDSFDIVQMIANGIKKNRAI